MDQINLHLLEIARVGIGILFLTAACLDIRSRPMLFELMSQKRIPHRWVFFVGAVTWKAVTSICLIFNIFTFWAALLLALYIFLASCILQNFWSMRDERRQEALVCFITNIAVSFGLLAVANGYQMNVGISTFISDNLAMVFHLLHC